MFENGCPHSFFIFKKRASSSKVYMLCVHFLAHCYYYNYFVVVVVVVVLHC